MVKKKNPRGFHPNDVSIHHVVNVEFPVSNTSKPRLFSEISCLRTCYGGNKSNVFLRVKAMSVW